MRGVNLLVVLRVFFTKQGIGMMGTSFSQSFQHQINRKNIFLVATTYNCWDPKCGRLENLEFWKKQSAVNLVSFCFWQMYVVFHFCTYFHSEWLIMSIYSIRKIARECFRLFCFLQIFEHSGYHASEIKNEEEISAVEGASDQPKFWYNTCG